MSEHRFSKEQQAQLDHSAAWLEDPRWRQCTMESEIVCPHCLREDGDSWEWANGEECYEETGECGWCGEEFVWSRVVQVSYNTMPPYPKESDDE